MTDRTDWVPEGVTDTVPSAARMYDYLLGGGHNFAVDREMIDKVLAVSPNAAHWARLNRAFLRHAVLTMAEQGVHQFLDIGSGIPTIGNVHEIAQQADPAARVVYVDNDPVAVTHSELVLEGNDQATVIRADMRDPIGIFQHPRTQQMLDLDVPIGLLMVTVFHYVADSDLPAELMAHYRDPLAPGSCLAVSHACSDVDSAATSETAAVMELVKQNSITYYPRTRAAIEDLFTGFELLPPGLVPTSEWVHPSAREGGNPSSEPALAGIGIKR